MAQQKEKSFNTPIDVTHKKFDTDRISENTEMEKEVIQEYKAFNYLHAYLNQKLKNIQSLKEKNEFGTTYMVELSKLRGLIMAINQQLLEMRTKHEWNFGADYDPPKTILETGKYADMP